MKILIIAYLVTWLYLTFKQADESGNWIASFAWSALVAGVLAFFTLIFVALVMAVFQ